MTVYGKAVLISVVAVVAFLISIMAFCSDEHFSDDMHTKITEALHIACFSAFVALVVSVIAYICKMM